jgi:hypothetical protein
LNASKVRQLSPAEIWLFIVGRVLVAFGLGVFAARYVPAVADSAAFPSVIVGAVLLALAAKGLWRKPAHKGDAGPPHG